MRIYGLKLIDGHLMWETAAYDGGDGGSFGTGGGPGIVVCDCLDSSYSEAVYDYVTGLSSSHSRTNALSARFC